MVGVQNVPAVGHRRGQFAEKFLVDGSWVVGLQGPDVQPPDTMSMPKWSRRFSDSSTCPSAAHAAWVSGQRPEMLDQPDAVDRLQGIAALWSFLASM